MVDLTKNKNEFVHELSELSSSANKSAEILGVRNIELLNFPDNKLDSIDRLVLIKKIEEKIKFYKDMIKDLYVTNKDLIVVVLCGLLVISWML